MHVRLMFPAEYLSSEDMEAAGRDVTLTISGLDQEEVRTDKGKEQRWVLSFHELDERHRKDNRQPRKRLILNKTNTKQIAKIHGSETNDWIGKRVTLYGTTCQAFGDTVPCIRVRPKAPKQTKKQEPEPVVDEWVDEPPPYEEEEAP
jgi:hypothetical protein